MQNTLKNLINNALKSLNIEDVDFVVEHPEDLKNGDYSTNVAMVCAKNLKTNPTDLAEKLKVEIEKNLPKEIEKVAVAGAGFINFYLSRKYFASQIEEILNTRDLGANNLFAGKKVMVEYTQPNPFKPFHIGHLMSNAIGESISRLVEISGAEVTRANYQGDLGLHVAKAIWGLTKNENLQSKDGTHNIQAENIGKAYAIGAQAYDTDENAKAEIDAINKKVYDRSDEKVNQVYNWGFEVTMKAFEDIYDMLGTQFDFYFLESEMAPVGEKIVKENGGEIFTESDGAIVFKAEEFDPKLHTRVFITSAGLPTYETKELGLTLAKFEARPQMDLSMVVTATEQMDYMKVVAKALSLLRPEYESKMRHITHGMMRFASGKMSSRKGNVITGESLIKDTKALVIEKMKERDFGQDEKEKIISGVAVAAIKYSILKQSMGGDIVYDFDNSISFEGDSGPYLQYSYARANSVLEKAKSENILPDFGVLPEEVSELEKLLYRFPEVVLRAASEHGPHYVANYLIEIARSFNSYYGNTMIVEKGDQTSPYKIALTFAFTFVMKKGLHLLGIQAPERM